MSLIYQLTNVKKVYGNRTVLDLPEFSIEEGELLAVVGPSGAGKSTLLRLLNFLEYPDEGTLRYRDQAAGPGMPLVVRREVTMVFQRPALLNGSVEKNVAYGLRLRQPGLSGSGLREQHETAYQAIRRLGMEKLGRAPARTLSGGEAQRVSLARAMVLQPRVLLLDEPTANLDPYNIGLIEEVVREVNRMQKTTIVLVTHNIFQAKRLASRIVLLLNGRAVESAPTQAFFDHPQDARTRAFVNGEMIY